MHGLAFKLRPRKTRCLPARIEIALLERIQPGKEMLLRIVAMLTKLVERFDPYQYRVRKSAQA